MNKPKYYNLFTHIGALLVLMCSVCYSYYLVDGNTSNYKLNFKQMDTVKIPLRDEISMMKRIENKLPGIAYPVVTDLSNVNMQMFGSIPVAVKTSGGIKKFVRPEKKSDYTVSFALNSGNAGICIINNERYSTGEALPCGSVISRIESHRIALLKNKKIRWLPVLRK